MKEEDNEDGGTNLEIELDEEFYNELNKLDGSVDENMENIFNHFIAHLIKEQKEDEKYSNLNPNEKMKLLNTEITVLEKDIKFMKNIIEVKKQDQKI